MGQLVRRAAAALVAAFAVLASPAVAAPRPFGHDCAARDGVRVCPTADLSQRVATFDGVPLDVDVTLPAEGEGPWPAIVMLHGYGGSKDDFQASSPEGGSTRLYHYNSNFFARRGYLVVTASARGFGRSCGAQDSRTEDCARGYVRLADHRYEARDAQHLVGLLVDEGLVRPDAIGVTGISYGGGQSAHLALLRDRVRLPDGSYAPWRSPRGTPLRIAAAWPKWLWSDLVYSLVPNGRYLDFRPATITQSREPLGVPIQSFVTGLYALGSLEGLYALPGQDPDADLTSWFARITAGDPYGNDVRGIADEIYEHHSAIAIEGATPAPLLLQDGWTDDLFPAGEALRLYNAVRMSDPDAPVALQLADLGHQRGQNKAEPDRHLNDQGAAFFDRWLKGERSAPAPMPGSVTAFTQTCPADAPAGGPFTATSWDAIHPGVVRYASTATGVVEGGSGDLETGQVLDPITGAGACATVAGSDVAGTVVHRLAPATGWTLLGRPTVTARIDTTGAGGQLAARLWDVAPDGRQTLVTRGVYRLRDGEDGEVVFQLNGNAYRFAPGHVPKLELLGGDAPYYRPSNARFNVVVGDLALDLPVADRPDGGQVEGLPASLRTGVRPAAVRGRALLRVSVTPRRDRRGTRRFRVSGRLVPPAGLDRGEACRGRVSAQWKAGRRTISTRRARVSPRCRFALRVSFREPRRFGRHRRLRLTVRFPGNRVLERSAPVRRRVRVR